MGLVFLLTDVLFGFILVRLLAYYLTLWFLDEFLYQKRQSGPKIQVEAKTRGKRVAVKIFALFDAKGAVGGCG